MLFVLLAAQIGAASNPNTPTAIQQSLPRLERTECFVPIRAWAGSVGLECSWLVVPADRDRPNGPVIRLPVALRRAPAPSGAPPLVRLHGGPGGAGAIIASSPALFNSAMARERDLIIYDQRGAGLAEPKICPEVGRDSVLQRGDTAASQQERWNAIARACVASLRTQGIEPSAYSSTANAADLADLRRVLGYTRWDLFGISYGGRLAFEAMRRDPGGIHAVVVESAVIPGPASSTEDPLTVWRSLQHLFSSCAADPTCNATFPSLARDFQEVYDSLARSPLEVSVSRGATTAMIAFDAEQYLRAVRCQLSNTRAIPRIPLLIHHLRRGDRSRAAGILVTECTGGAGFNPMVELVGCYDTWGEAQRSAHAAIRDSVPPMFLIFEEEGEECGFWQQRFADPADLEPVRSDIPTLLYTGEFDERTPTAHSRRAMTGLSHAYLFEVPGESHGSPPVGCPAAIIEQFLKNPAQQPDEACLRDMRVSFETKDLIVPTLFFSVTASAGTNVFAGRWEAEVPNAPRVLTFNLDINNGRISGTLDPQRLEVFDGGTQGQTIRFKVKSPDGLRTVTFTGVLSEDAIAFTREVDPPTSPTQGGRGILGVLGPRTFMARRLPP